MNYLNYLLKHKEDRAFLANCRGIFSQSSFYKIMPFLALYEIINDPAAIMIVGLFGLHPVHSNKIGNFGTSCFRLRIMKKEKLNFDLSAPLNHRFLLILRSKITERHLIGMVKMISGFGIPIDYCKLDEDLHHWGDDVKVEWSKKFWKAE